MARWTAYSLPILIGILALVSTVVLESDGHEGSSLDTSRVSPGSSDDKSLSKSKSGKPKKNRKKHKKHKAYVESRTSESSSSTRATRVPYKGDGGLTELTWKEAFLTGGVYMGRSYFNTSRYRRKPHKMPTICENRNLLNRTFSVASDNRTSDVVGVVLFYCPGDRDPDDYDHCCGDVGYEECCPYQSPNVPLILGILSALVAVAVIIFGCCIWKRIHQKRELDKPLAEHVVAATLTDPMLPPSIVTSPPPPPTQDSFEEKVPVPDIDNDKESQQNQIAVPEVDGTIPKQTQEHIVINSSTPPVSGPPPQAV